MREEMLSPQVQLLMAAVFKRLETIEAKLDKKVAYLPVDDAVTAYQKHLAEGVNKRGRRFTEDSIRNFSWFLDRFGQHFAERNIAEITTEECNAFLMAYWQNTSSGTYRQRITQLRVFFNFCIQLLKRRGSPIFYNPADLLDPIEHHVEQPVWIPIELMRMLIKSAQDKNCWLALAIMATAGLRIADLMNLRYMDVEGRILHLRAHGNYRPKSGKREEIAVIPAIVSQYIDAVRRQPEMNVITMSESSVYMAVRRHGRRFGLHIGTHDLRKWCASYWERMGEYGMVNFVLRHSATQLRDRYVAPLSVEEAIAKQNLLEKELFN